MLKQSIDLILDTIGLPPCNDINKASKMIREAVKKDTRLKRHIDEVIKVCSDIVYNPGSEHAEELNMSFENKEPIEAVKSYVA